MRKIRTTRGKARKKPSLCTGCILQGCDKKKTMGSRDAEYLIVVKPPTKLTQQRALAPASLEMLMGKLKSFGFVQSQFVIHNSVSCYYDKDELISKEIRDIKAQCRKRMVNVINKMKPKMILAVGGDAAAQVEGRTVKITKVRGVAKHSEEFDCLTMPIQDPGQVMMYPQMEALLDSDIATFRRLVRTEFDIDEASRGVLGDNYETVTDLQFLVDQQPEVLAYDVETLGLNWARRGRKLLSMQFCTRPGHAYILPWDHPERPLPSRQRKKVRRQLRELLTNPNTQVIGHNLKYDLMWTWEVLGFRFRIAHDTLMMMAIMDENIQSKDLDTCIKLYVKEMAGYADNFNNKFDKERMDRVPWANLVDYGCGDVDASLRLFNELLPLLSADFKLYNHYQRVSMPGINAFASMERTGLAVNETALDEFEQFMADYVMNLEGKLLDQIPRSVKQAQIDQGKNLSFTRGDFIRDVLFNHPDGFRLTPVVFTKKTKNMAPERRLASTSAKDHLPYFFDQCEFTIDLAEWSKANRLLNTSIRRFRENYITNGKIYPQYSLWTTVTGRSSSSNPNGQNIPKRGTYAKMYRRLFVPPPGHVLLEADLSQAELRIAGSMANDPVMIGIYARDGDIHAETAAATMGLTLEQFYELPPEDQGQARFQAKAINFGFIYGMGWRNFIVYAKTQYGVEFTEKEAQDTRSAFFQKYPNLTRWHNVMREFAQDNEYVRSYSGRKRHLPMIHSDEEGIQQEAMRQAINSPVQEFGSSLGIMAMSQIDQEIDPQYFQLCGFVHDAIYAFVPYEYVEWGAHVLKSYMENVPLQEWFNLNMPIPIKADVGFGLNAGDTHELSGLDPAVSYDFSKFEGIELPEQQVPPSNGLLSHAA